jgi:hypothetical protein
MVTKYVKMHEIVSLSLQVLFVFNIGFACLY